MTSPSTKLTWLVLLAAAGGAVYYFGPWRKAKDADAVRYDTAAVDRGPLVAKVTASGTLSALVTVQIGSQVSGRVKEITVDYNAEVTKGQLLARIDPLLFEAALNQARASHAATAGDHARSLAQTAEAKRQLTRAQKLAEQKLVAQAELDTALANAEAADAQVAASLGRLAQAKAALGQAQVNLAYTRITSPIDGVVISRNVDVGQTVAASLQAPTLFVLAEDLRKMQVNTSVAEADIGKLRAGMGATFTVDAYPLKRFSGSVRQIRNAAQTVQNVVTYDAVIDVDNPDLELKPGMTANVTFVYAERDHVLRVPNAALRFKPTTELLAAGAAGAKAANGQPGGGRAARGGGDSGAPPSNKRTVWVLRGAQASAVELTVGITNGSQTEVIDGALREGEALITDAPGDEKSGMQGPPMPMRRVL